MLAIIIIIIIIIINTAACLQIHVRNLACLSQALDNALITSYQNIIHGPRELAYFRSFLEMQTLPWTYRIRIYNLKRFSGDSYTC